MTSISINSPGWRSALMYLHFNLVVRYFRTRPLDFSTLPTVRSWMKMPSSSKSHFIFKAHSSFLCRISIILSLILIGVSLGLLLGAVDLGSSPVSPCFLNAASHLSRLRLPYGHTFAASFSLIFPWLMGNTYLNLSSLIVFAMFIAMRPAYRWPRKPPNVRAHYLKILTIP